MKQKRQILKLKKKNQKKLLIIVVSAILALFGINSGPAQELINNYFDISYAASQNNDSNASTYKKFSLIDEAKPYAKSIGKTDKDAEKAQVLRVVDGDTLIVRLNKEQERIRLIGIDAPESVHPDASRNSAQGKNASEHLKAGLHKGDIVYLTFDKEREDKYKRTLAYVWLAPPPLDPTESDIKHLMLNGILVDQGFANPKAFKPNTLYKSIFESIANQR